MLELDIPGFRALSLQYLVADFNGTLARDGQLLPEVGTLLKWIVEHHAMSLVVATGDTYGSARHALVDLPCRLAILTPERQARQKLALVEELGAERVVAIGNGRNDVDMLRVAALSIAVVGLEGLAGDAMRHVDVVAGSIHSALTLLIKPAHLLATLRS